MRKSIWIIVILILLVVGISLFYLKDSFNHNNLPLTLVGQQQPIQNPLNELVSSTSKQAKIASVVSTSTIQKTKTIETSTTSIVVTSKLIDCGSMDSVSAYSDSPNVETKQALICMSRLLSACTPATVQVTFFGKTLGEYKILGKQGQYCPIYENMKTNPSSMSATIKTCNLPLDFIAQTQKNAESENLAYATFNVIPLVFMSATSSIMTDVKTGQKTTIDCSLN